MKIWSVNTNNSNFVDNKGSEMALNQNRVITWHLNELKKIMKNDLVLSFNNYKEIVAVGYALSKVKQYSEDGQNASQEQWIEVNWIWKGMYSPISLEAIGINRKLRKVVENVSKDIDIKKLLTEIGKRQA